VIKKFYISGSWLHVAGLLIYTARMLSAAGAPQQALKSMPRLISGYLKILKENSAGFSCIRYQAILTRRLAIWPGIFYSERDKRAGTYACPS